MNSGVLDTIESTRCYGGWQNVYRHASTTCHYNIVFTAYLPPANKPVLVLWCLSGLTCTHKNAMTQAHLQYYVAKYGIAMVYPDTSLRGTLVADDDTYDFGQGADSYVNAAQAPWKAHYQMYGYIVHELPALLSEQFEQLDFTHQGITGHSMGGHVSLAVAINNQLTFTSVSAFAPITITVVFSPVSLETIYDFTPSVSTPIKNEFTDQRS